MKHILLWVGLLSSQLAFAMAHRVSEEQAVAAAVQRYGLPAEPHLIHAFQHAQVSYPPRSAALLAFKKERHIELWAKNKGQAWRYITTYPLTAFSGRLGPKLRERDGQIPEGVYHLTALNPFSQWHLSMMINYPNSFDRLQAQKEGRQQLGGNIFLHGRDRSVGCLAVGDRAIDQLFMLARRVGLSHMKLIIAPNDLRKGRPATVMMTQPPWVSQLYRQLQDTLKTFS